jgi:uncharacterized protein (TIGR03435 family)
MATGDVLTYACALAELEGCRADRTQTALAASGGNLAERIGRLLGQPFERRRAVSGPELVAGVILLVLTAAGLFAQAGDRPKFEVASVKAGAEQPFISVRALPGGRLTAAAPAIFLIQNAYGLQPFQVSGGPGWLQTDRFEVDARAGDNAGRERLMLMLQALLEDRFQLRSHRETKELPAYNLMAVKNGPKLPPPSPGSCAAVDSGGPPPGPPRPGQPLIGPCGRLVIMAEPSGARLQGGQIEMPELTRILSMIMSRSVIDKTGFSGKFDVKLEFSVDAASAGLPKGRELADTADMPNPSIFSAVQEQLGLKLEGTKGPVEIMVIDHMERPSAN